MYNIGQSGIFEFLALRSQDSAKSAQFHITTRGHYSKEVVAMNGVIAASVYALVKHEEMWMRYKFKIKSDHCGFRLEPSNDSLFNFTLTFK